MNLPNKLTIFRIILVPVMVIIPFLGIPGTIFNIPIQNIIILAIFAIASYTDHLDGKLARKNNMVTTFGKFADPLADKILVLSAMLLLMKSNYDLPAWIPIIVLTREFAVSGYRLIAVEKGGKVIAASIWGKLKTVTQMIAIMIAFIDINSFGACFNGLTGFNLIINILSTSLMLISTIAAVFSGIDYLKGGKELFK